LVRRTSIFRLGSSAHSIKLVYGGGEGLPFPFFLGSDEEREFSSGMPGESFPSGSPPFRRNGIDRPRRAAKRKRRTGRKGKHLPGKTPFLKISSMKRKRNSFIKWRAQARTETEIVRWFRRSRDHRTLLLPAYSPFIQLLLKIILSFDY